jgi:hypothetical protein
LSPAACDTVSDLSATLTVAVRVELLVLAVRVTVNEPVPVRPDAELKLSQLEDSLADHAHPAAVVTVTVDEPDVDGTASVVVLSVYVHGVAACVIVTVLPATVIVAVRDEVPVLAAIE